MTTIRVAGLALAATMSLAIVTVSASGALAQSAPSREDATRAMAQDTSAQNRNHRPRVRIYREDERGVYPSYNPGPDAVRDCTATYVQEFRPSGTVIVPRMNCYWRHG
jgi:hypothetical protein